MTEGSIVRANFRVRSSAKNLITICNVEPGSISSLFLKVRETDKGLIKGKQSITITNYKDIYLAHLMMALIKVHMFTAKRYNPTEYNEQKWAQNQSMENVQMSNECSLKESYITPNKRCTGNLVGESHQIPVQFWRPHPECGLLDTWAHSHHSCAGFPWPDAHGWRGIAQADGHISVGPLQQGKEQSVKSAISSQRIYGRGLHDM